ncbi:response regulator transcription factor [Paraburkholderia sediminicola]|uniref:response regulator transcription factor n=1 Tax=Paraburkholderia sediminicola TaxID=458836 RepID=UPI0038B83BCD
MLTALTIHNEPALEQEITTCLKSSGFNVDVTCLGRAGLSRAISNNYDVVLLGQSLPDITGPAFVSALRGIGMQTPVIMISSISNIADRIRGLRAGADDYMMMPFSPDEMLARVDVLMRKRVRLTNNSAVLRTNALELDLVKHIVALGDRKQCLLPTECRLLEFMMRHTDRILTRSEIFEAVWGYHFDPGTNLIDVHVGRLRKKFAAFESPPTIVTIRGAGFRFRCPV